MVDPMRNKLVHKVRPLIFCVLGGLTLIYAMLAEERDSSLLSFGFIVFWAACLELWNPFSKPFRHKDVSSYEIDFLRRHSLRIHMILALSIWFAAIPSGFYLLQSDLWNNSGWIKGLLLILLLIAFVSGFYADIKSSLANVQTEFNELQQTIEYVRILFVVSCGVKNKNDKIINIIHVHVITNSNIVNTTIIVST